MIYLQDFLSKFLDNRLPSEIYQPYLKCEFASARPEVLKSHKETRHNGLIFPCDQCDFVTTRQDKLKRHTRTKHEGLRYPCDECDFVSTRLDRLKRHKEATHQGILHKCGLCEFTSSRIGKLSNEKRELTTLLTYLGYLVVNPPSILWMHFGWMLCLLS